MAERPSFSPSNAWDEVSRMLRAETRLIVPIAGVFFLLPAALVDLFGPSYSSASTLAEAMAIVRPYLPALFVSVLVQYVGQLAIFSLMLSPERPTVGGAIARGFALLPFYVLVMLVSNLMLAVGFLLLILPGLYLLARLAPLSAVFVAEDRRWPFPAIARSFEITKGNALPIFGFLLIVGLIYIVLVLAASFVLGAIFGVAGFGMERGEAGATTLAFIGAVISAAGTTVFTLMAVAIYRQLAGEARVERAIR